ncbi:unnamed protein product [Caenorhabditis auriculariae]|uniref:Uncharacterized protein n=1 Tax=Caenorhabditis auriculariae TaxID=2777116 RepID=A0A8S1H224_9PELO|nr:unnamed protein product [Caenorhabditis auriculariae]
MDRQQLYYYLYRDANTSNDELVQVVVNEIKHFVFDAEGIVLSPQGYSGIPVVGQTALNCREDDLWKILDVLFRVSHKVDGLVFRIATANIALNPFYIEAVKNDVIPRWANSPEDFATNVFGYAGVLHVISPEIRAKYPGVSDVEIIRIANRETRNILITESVKQILDAKSARDFGMQRTSVNLPQNVAYIAKQRPDLLSAAIREFSNFGPQESKKHERVLEQSDCVMVHILLNDTDWKSVTAFADIESPCDIVSHRTALAMIAFDEKYAKIENGLDTPSSNIFRDVPDVFEREKLESTQAALYGTPHSLAHRYQMAKALTTSKHHAECRKLFVDDGSSSHEQNDSVCSGDDESYKVTYARKQVFKKKRGELGKKRTLAQVALKNNAPELPEEEHERPQPTNSGQLRNFERAVNGDDVYHESSDGDSLGEDEEMDLFVTKPKKVVLNGMQAKLATCKKHIEKKPPSEDEAGFDVADLLRAAPPLAKTDDFEDFDDI